MDINTLYNINNLIFVSEHEGVVGSLYFRARVDDKVYRGRIRLCHEHGPQVTEVRPAEKYWQLAKEIGTLEGYTEADGDKVYGNFVTDNEDRVLEAAKGHTIYENYTGRTHFSRGQLRKKEICADVTQKDIDSIIATIEKNKGKSPCEANAALMKLSLPRSLQQRTGFYGC